MPEERSCLLSITLSFTSELCVFQDVGGGEYILVRNSAKGLFGIISGNFWTEVTGFINWGRASSYPQETGIYSYFLCIALSAGVVEIHGLYGGGVARVFVECSRLKRENRQWYKI